MEKINFKNKGETDAVSINADNLNLLQTNVENEFDEIHYILNKYLECVFDSDLTFPASNDAHAKVPFDTSYGNDKNNLYLSDYCVTIGKNIKKIKIDYNVRMEWDAPTSVTYDFMITTSNRDLWATQRTISKTDSRQHGVCVSSVVLDVEEGTQVALLVWNSTSEQKTAKMNINMFVQVLE